MKHSFVRRRYLSDGTLSSPFSNLDADLQEEIRVFSLDLAIWIGKVNTYHLEEVHDAWKRSSALRWWLSKHVNLPKYDDLYYGFLFTAERSVEVGDTYKSPHKTQHWATEAKVSRGYAGIGLSRKARPSFEWSGGALVRAKASARDVIVDTERFGNMCKRYKAEFSEIQPRDQVIELFTSLPRLETEVITSAAVHGTIVEVTNWRDDS